ncbi:MAG: MATE family efflux transporter [Ruminococcus sp.]|uniref:MATE family efflux transporter n=1 Tax=Ruminococcus sp. TaxID=41978 RepID=UPI0025D4001A|nr:MATE family efflux transporter [Ruminococcus sp.]MCR4794775.1 MATE family efflux transporter [Ruminococcus sp.]
MQSKSSDMCEGPLISRVILYTIPIILTGILQLLFNAADLVVVGRCCGSNSVGAVGATGAIINLMVNLFIGLSVGAGVTVAHGIGSGRSEDVRRTVHTAVPTAVISGAILTVIGVLFSETFLRMMNTPPEQLNLAASYMRIYFCGTIASMLYNFGSAILRAAGDTKSPLYFLTAAGVLNVILNLIFVIAFRMDVAGVALATTVSQVVSAALIIRALMKRDDACKLELKKIHIYGRQLKRILQIGFPAGIQSSLFAISNVIIQSSINSFGSVVTSGNAAAQNIEGFVYTSMNSYSQTALNFTGQNYGAGKLDRIRKIMWVCLISVFVTGLALGLTALFFGRSLLSIYITDSEKAIDYGIIRMTYIMIPYFLCGLMDVATGLIRGLGRSVLPMLITIAGVVGMRLGWIYIVFRIPEYHTLKSLYLSYLISWAMTFAAEIIVFIVIMRKIKNQRMKQ